MPVSNEFKYEIVKEIAVLSEDPRTGWTKEINLISYNGTKAKYDIRVWAPNHERMGKGITMSDEEMQIILESCKDFKA